MVSRTRLGVTNGGRHSVAYARKGAEYTSGRRQRGLVGGLRRFYRVIATIALIRHFRPPFGFTLPGEPPAAAAGRTRFGSGFGMSVMLPAGPLSVICCGEMLSIRQSLSDSPSDKTTDLAPLAKIAMRGSGSIAMRVSLTSAGRRSPVLSEGES